MPGRRVKGVAGYREMVLRVGQWKGSDMTESEVLATPRTPESSPSDLTGRTAPMTNSVTPPGAADNPPRRTRTPIKSRWYREVVRSPLISDSVRVLLLVLHEDMSADGFVSVPRTQLAERLNKNPRRIAERFEQAVAAGFLDRTRAGRPTVTAEYKAMLPDAGTKRVRPSSSKPIERLMKPEDERDGADVRMVRIAAPTEVRSSAPSAHAQHGADDRPANYSSSRRRSPQESPGSTSESPFSSKKKDVEPRGGEPQRLGEVFEVMFGRPA